MWTESGRCTEESKSAAGNFSGDQQSKWGHSSVSYAQSIEGLSNRSWDEIETGALEFATRGRRFKAPGMNGHARACIVDCDSEDEDTSTNVSDKELEHTKDGQTRDWDRWTMDEDTPSATSPHAQAQDSLCIESTSRSLTPLSAAHPAINRDRACMEDDACQSSEFNYRAGGPYLIPIRTLNSNFADCPPALATTDDPKNHPVSSMGAHTPLPPLSTFFEQMSLPPVLPTGSADSFQPAVTSQPLLAPAVHQVNQCFSFQPQVDLFTQASGLHYRGKFLTGPLQPIDMEDDAY